MKGSNIFRQSRTTHRTWRIVPALCALVVFAVSAAFAHTLDFSGTASGDIVGLPTDDPNIYSVFLRGSGQSEELGQFRVTTHHFTDLQTGEFLNGVLVMRMANGDRLFGTYVGNTFPTEDPNVFTLYGTYHLHRRHEQLRRRDGQRGL